MLIKKRGKLECVRVRRSVSTSRYFLYRVMRVPRGDFALASHFLG